MKVWRYVALMGVPFFPVSVLAQDQCADAPQILAFADTILADRAEVGRLQQRRIGAEAAYVKIMYGDPDAATIDAMLAELLAEPMPDALELLATYTIATSGIERGLDVLDPDPVRAISMAGPSARRAVLLADNGMSYFSLLRAAMDVPATEGVLTPQARMGLDSLFLVSDQDDDTLLAMSQSAEAAGFVPAAAVLAAGMSSLDAYDAVIARHPDDPYLVEQATYSWLGNTGATLRYDTGPVPRADAATQAERGASDQAFFPILRAMYMDGPASYSSTVMNQTGWLEDGQTVAMAFLAELDEGRLDPIHDPEGAWLFQYRAWAALKGREDVHAVLGFFDFPSQRLRHFAGSALQTLDWMIAKEALRPYLTGQTTTLPTRPALLSDGFDWPMWVEVGGMLDTDSGGLLHADPERQRVAMELLGDAGRFGEMEALAGAALEPFDRLSLLRDMMMRLDRKCEAWTASAGQAMFLSGDFLFRF